MKNKRASISVCVIVIGLILAVAVHFLTSIRWKPVVDEQTFTYAVTYTVDGETKTYNGVYTCRFDGFGVGGIDPLARYYEGEYTADGDRYTIAQQDGYELYIVTMLNDCYLMGDTKNEYYDVLQAPYLEAADAEGYQYDEAELPAVFDAEIVRWEYPEPVENSFVFAGFAGPHTDSMYATMLVGLLALILCMILVKKSDGVVYSVLDKIGIVVNFVMAIGVLPLMTLIACLIQLYPTGPDWIYRLELCIPTIMLFTLASSVSLRRKGFRWSGFFIQFTGVILWVLLAVLEYIL